MNWRQYLPTVRERGAYTGPFSTYAEYHAVGVGFLLGPEMATEVAAYGVGSGAGRTYGSGHLRDAAREVAYTGLGVGLRMAAMVAVGVVA